MTCIRYQFLKWSIHLTAIANKPRDVQRKGWYPSCARTVKDGKMLRQILNRCIRLTIAKKPTGMQ